MDTIPEQLIVLFNKIIFHWLITDEYRGIPQVY